MGNNLIHQRKLQDRGHGKQIDENARPGVRLEDLPWDLVVYKILSKLPLKEAAKTSVLSTKWRCIWLTCPRLCFDGLAMFKCERGELFLHARQFIAQVNAVLQKYQGEVVEEFHIRFDFHSIPAHYLDNWVIFSLSSKMKNLALDLQTNDIERYPARYKFPFELLDSGSLSGLQHVQFSFVSIKPPSKFRGFPNLRKLDLQLLDASSKDFETMLSNCKLLEWLSMDRCRLNGELRVGSPLPRLVYLQVVYCQVTKIQFHAVELANFVYKGDFVPIALKHSLKLENANIRLYSLNDRHAISDLVKCFPNLQNLNFHLSWNDAETKLLSDTPWKFSHLRYLRLKNFADSGIVETNFFVSFLRAAPFIEKLEIHRQDGPEIRTIRFVPAAPNGTIAEDWRTFQFTGRSVQRLKEEITSRAGEATQYCVQAGRYGRLIPLTHELPHNTETIDIIIMMTDPHMDNSPRTQLSAPESLGEHRVADIQTSYSHRLHTNNVLESQQRKTGITRAELELKTRNIHWGDLNLEEKKRTRKELKAEYNELLAAENCISKSQEDDVITNENYERASLRDP